MAEIRLVNFLSGCILSMSIVRFSQLNIVTLFYEGNQWRYDHAFLKRTFMDSP
jgi:hypothetical protein